jgi:ATP-dependent helicase Lhr and Lhr-like helicase
VRWPGDDPAESGADGRGALRPKRAAGARVVVHDGRLVAWMGRSERGLVTFLPPNDPERGAEIRALCRALAGLVDEGRARVVLMATVDGEPTERSPLADALREVGFVATSHGFLRRQTASIAPTPRSFGAGEGWGRPWAGQRSGAFLGGGNGVSNLAAPAGARPSAPDPKPHALEPDEDGDDLDDFDD